MKPWRSLAGLPREVWILFAVCLVNRLGTMALPFLVLYLTKSVGLTATTAGLFLAVYGVAALVAASVGGRLADSWGPLVVMRVSMVASGLVLLVYPLARSLPALLALTALWALSGEAFRPANLSAITSLVPPEKRKPAFALIRLAINLGMSVGPAAGGFLASVSLRSLFVVDGATSLAAGGVLLLSRFRSAPREESPKAGPSGGALSDRRLVYFLAAMIPVSLVFFQHESAMPLFLVNDLHLTERFYGLLFTLNTLLIVALEVPLNAAMAEWPHRRTLALGSLLFGVGFGLLAVSRGPLLVAVTVVIWTFGEMVLLPGMSAYVADIAPPDRRGSYMGLYTMSFSLAFAVGPWLGTATLTHLGPATLWLGTLALGLVSAGLLARVEA